MPIPNPGFLMKLWWGLLSLITRDLAFEQLKYYYFIISVRNKNLNEKHG